jgi:hypothetical protein
MVTARLATLLDGQRQVGQLAEVPTQAKAAAARKAEGQKAGGGDRRTLR